MVNLKSKAVILMCKVACVLITAFEVGFGEYFKSMINF